MSSRPQAERFSFDEPWELHPQVAVRREPFGALAYHFGTRRLSFLKSPQLRAVVEALSAHPSPRQACLASGVREERLPAFQQALGRLAASGMIRRRAEA